MCGIVCYNGEKSAVEIILNGLKSLEYRGYDSSGISVVTDKIETVKRKGKLQNLIDSIDEIDNNASVGIGHIRWATHGEPNEINAHPQVSEDGKFSVVHNGIIENYKELKKELEDTIKGKIYEEMELESEGNGIIYSLPVSEVSGLVEQRR